MLGVPVTITVWTREATETKDKEDSRGLEPEGILPKVNQEL